jgi:hypothetical protein
MAMFFSMNNDSFRDHHPDLVKFVLDRSSRNFSPRYKIDLVLVRGGFARSAGI